MSETAQASEARCWACRGAIDAGDRFCRHCGKRQQQGVEWYFRPLWIIVMAFVVVGPLALPLVWRSPALSRNSRFWLTAAIVIYTVLVLVLFVVLTKIMLDYTLEQMEMLKSI